MRFTPSSRSSSPFRLAILPLLMLPFLLLAGCGDDPTSPAPSVAVSVNPTTATVPAGGSVTLTASVTNSTNTAVTWTATGGSITGTGSSVSWQAPVQGGSHTVTATSVADPASSASTSLTVTPAAVSISPSAPALFRGEPVTFTASVAGVAAGQTGVSWSVSCGDATPSEETLAYVAPTDPGECTITATSTLDPDQSATAVVTIRSAWLVTTTEDVAGDECNFSGCTLRAALAIAQAAPDPDTIVLGTGFSSAGSGGQASAAALEGSIVLTSPLPPITTPVVLMGPGADLLAIDAGGSEGSPRRVLDFAGGVEASVVGLTLRGGHSPGAGGVAVYGASEVHFTDVSIRDNQSTAGAGGGLQVAGESTVRLVESVVENNSATGASAAGGGIDLVQNSALIMEGGAVRGNLVPEGWGGGIRVFDGDLTLTDVAVEGNDAGLDAGGGGIAAQGMGNLTITGGRVSGNTTQGIGGGIWVFGQMEVVMTETEVDANEAGWGGGIGAGNQVTLTLVSTSVSDNVAVRRGGGLELREEVVATLEETVVSGNLARGEMGASGGAGIFMANTVVLQGTNLEVSGNESAGFAPGGGIAAFPGTRIVLTGGEIRENTVAGAGGGIWAQNAVLELEGVVVAGNEASTQGGGIMMLGSSVLELVDVEISQNRTTGTTGNDGVGGGVRIFGPVQSTFTNVVVSENAASTAGGGVALGSDVAGSVAVLNGGSVQGNTAATVGGGILLGGTASMEAHETRFLENQAGGQGGGLFLVGSGPAVLDRVEIRANEATTASGGGVAFGTTGTLSNATVSGNRSGGIGGGVWGTSTGNFALVNVTVSGNEAVGGGGVAYTGIGSLRNVTVVGNTSTDEGAGIWSNNAGSPTLTSVLLGGNRREGQGVNNCAIGGSATILSGGHNLSDDASCTSLAGTGDLRDVPAGVVASLADNGGATATHALEEGSAAIDAGRTDGCPATDQRGFSRVGNCDIGAFEFGGTPSGMAASAEPGGRTVLPGPRGR